MKIVEEYRLYYDDSGKALTYGYGPVLENTKYIVIDPITFAEGRLDVRVKDGKIIRNSDYILISKMSIKEQGISCASQDVCIITNEGKTNTWGMDSYEYKCD